MIKTQNKKGFTLVEILIYIGLLSISGALLSGVLLNTTRIKNRQTAVVEVNNQLNFVLQSVQRSIMDSSVIDINNDVSTSTLILQMKDDTKNPTKIYITDGILYKKEASNTAQPLTNSMVVVDAVNFLKVSGYTGHDSVKVDLTISYNTQNPTEDFSRTLSSAIARVSAATFDSNLIPGSDNFYDVGVSATKWKDMYLSGDLFAAGSVGIGNTDPEFALEIKSEEWAQLALSDTAGGTVKSYLSMKSPTSSGTSYAGWSINRNANTGVFGDTSLSHANIYLHSTDGASKITFGTIAANNTIATERMRIDENGNVGIGTTAPTGMLHISGQNSQTQHLLTLEQTFTRNPMLQWTVGGAGGIWTAGVDRQNLAVGGANAFHISNSSTLETSPRFSITTTGNVGIGTVTPLDKLQVNGDISIYGTEVTSQYLNFRTSHGAGALAGYLGMDYGYWGGTLRSWVGRYAGGSGTQHAFVIGVVDNGYPDQNTHFSINLKDMNPSSNGIFYVGLGSTTVSTTPSIYTENGAILAATRGSVGIGTTDPGAKLHVDAPSTNAPSLTFGASAGQILQNEDSEFAFGLLNVAPYSLWIQGRQATNAARDISLQPLGGNIGIGTTTPSQTLSVDGKIYTSDSFIFADGSVQTTAAVSGVTLWTLSGSDIYRTTGNVGIGTANPAAKLDVAGTINISGSWSAGGVGYSRVFHAGNLCNGKIYYWAGLNSTNTIRIYDISSGYYSYGSAGGTARYNHTGNVYNGNIYYWGGYGKITTVDIYNISGNSWSTGLTGGVGRYGHTGNVYNGKIYYWGGSDGTATYLNSVDIYDIATNSWSTGTVGGTARYNHTGNVYNGKIYYWGGESSVTWNELNTVDIYDIVNDSWSTGTTGGTSRQDHIGIIYNGKIYYWGGRTDWSPFNTIDIYDVINNSWSTDTAGGTNRHGHTGIFYDGKIYYHGGRTSNSPAYLVDNIYYFGRLTGGIIEIPGTIANIVTAQTRDQTTYTAPTTGNGTVITPLNLTITPKKAGNKVILEWIVNGEGYENTVYIVTRNGELLANTTNVSNNRWAGITSQPYDANFSTTPDNAVVKIIDMNSLGMETTYELRVRASRGSASTLYFNRTVVSTGADDNEASLSTGVAMEIWQ
jgi:type II secretory pathway pseudopilin PulG